MKVREVITIEERVLVEIYLPIAQRTFDVYLPVTIKLQQVVDTCMEWKEQLGFTLLEQPMLYHTQADAILQNHLSVHEAGIHQGTRLILM